MFSWNLRLEFSDLMELIPTIIRAENGKQPL